MSASARKPSYLSSKSHAGSSNGSERRIGTMGARFMAAGLKPNRSPKVKGRGDALGISAGTSAQR